jgi:hypothetical protein
MVLASPNCCPEDVRILTVVIAELELGDIQRHILPAHFVECSGDATLEDRPEAFDGLSVDRADHILAVGMINDPLFLFIRANSRRLPRSRLYPLVV